MCGSMADIRSAAAEIRRRKKEEEERKNKPQHENIYGLPIPYGDHKILSIFGYSEQSRQTVRGTHITRMQRQYNFGRTKAQAQANKE